MKRTFIKIITVVAVFAMVLSLNSFAAVGDSVANVFLEKVATDVTGDYYGLEDWQTYTEWANTQGYDNILGPECAVDGRFDDWGDYSRWVAKPGPGVIEIDLEGYYALETLDIYHVWYNGYENSDCEWTSVEVSVDGGKTWTTVLDKVTLAYDDYILMLDSSLAMGVVKSTVELNGAVASKVRVIFDDEKAAELGFNIQELQCSGKVAEKPAVTETQAPATDDTTAPDTFDGFSVAVVVVALGAFGFVVSKKRR